MFLDFPLFRDHFFITGILSLSLLYIVSWLLTSIFETESTNKKNYFNKKKIFPMVFIFFVIAPFFTSSYFFTYDHLALILIRNILALFFFILLYNYIQNTSINQKDFFAQIGLKKSKIIYSFFVGIFLTYLLYSVLFKDWGIIKFLFTKKGYHSLVLLFANLFLLICCVETILRGIIQQSLTVIFNPHISIFLTSTLGGSLIVFPYIHIYGFKAMFWFYSLNLILSLLYARSENIWVTTSAHLFLLYFPILLTQSLQ